MKRESPRRLLVCVCVMALAAAEASADVFNMGGTRNADGSWTGLASLETVVVGDPGNAGDTMVMPDGTSHYGTVNYTYLIGKYEVTAGQYVEFLNAVAGIDTCWLYSPNMWANTYGCGIERWDGNGTAESPYRYRVAAGYANRPVNFVGWGAAARFANWLHNGQPTGVQDLTTTEDGAYYLNGATTNSALLVVGRKAGWRWAIAGEDEWYKAAYYKGGSADAGYWPFATGCAVGPGHQLNDLSGSNANFAALPNPIDPPYYTTVVGEFENSDSPYGTFDQSGNVFEWNEDAYPLGRPCCRIRRGGSFDMFGTSNMSSICRTQTYPDTPESKVGFRVVGFSAPDSDGDGVMDERDRCPDTVRGVPVDPDGCPADITGDFDRNGAVDSIDLGIFQDCISGPALPYRGNCGRVDLDHDNDVDMDDFGIFQRCYSGEDVPADPNCAN